MKDALPAPARYFPLQKGIYEVAPGLASLGTSFGNGERDGQVFQLDREFGRYRDNKLRARSERLGKYCCVHGQSPEVEAAVARFVLGRLLSEHPRWFDWDEGERRLRCALTGDALWFDGGMRLVEQRSAEPLAPAYVSAFDALCSQVQEDVAVVSLDPVSRKDWLSAIHLCSPSHWAAEDKIGRDFVRIHEPVAGIEKLNRAASSLVEAMIRKGPYVRFAWGFGTDDRLNHHPVPPDGVDAKAWRGRSWDGSVESPFILRVERQVTYGLPEVNAALFLIRLYFIDGRELRANAAERALLRAALLSMSSESREYKGLAQCMSEVIDWLDQGC